MRETTVIAWRGTPKTISTEREIQTYTMASGIAQLAITNTLGRLLSLFPHRIVQPAIHVPQMKRRM
jgi:hypothetical protein